nr:hypothetical protein [Tanacetum cinerariifolium]
LNFRRSTFRPKPTLDAPSAKRAHQGVPQVPAASFQVPVVVPAIPSSAADVSIFAATTPEVPAADVSVSAATIPEVHAAESRSADTPTASAHVSIEHSVAASTHSFSCIHHKHIAKKQVTPIVDIADATFIKFDSDRNTKHFTSLHELLHMVERTDLQKLLGTVDNLYQREDPDT